MTPTTRKRFDALRALLPIAGAAFIAAYLVVAFSRLTYPYELEWAEGLVVDHLVRIHRGEPLYVEPTIEFAPLLYNPLYFYVSAVTAIFTDVGFLATRLTSLLASLGVLGLLFAIVRRETHNWRAGLVAAGLFAACFRAAGAWYDVARADSLMLFFLLASTWFLLAAPNARNQVLGGACAALAFFCKQPAFLMAGALSLGALVCLPRARWWFAATAVLCGGLGVLWLHLASDGWYWFYAFEMPRGHAINPRRWVGYWSEDLLSNVPVLFFAAWIATLPAKDTGGASETKRRGLLLAIVLASAILMSYGSRLHEGGFHNTLMPAFAFLSLFGGLALGRVELSMRGMHRVNARMLLNAAVALGLVQFAMLRYDPRTQIPTAADVRAQEAFHERLAQVEGEILVVSHGFVAERLGKPMTAHFLAIGDIMRGERDVGRKLKLSMQDAIAAKRWDAIVLDKGFLMKQIGEHYVDQGIEHENDVVLRPLVGRSIAPDLPGGTRPRFFFVPKPSGQ